eukprot:2995013-Amphidinium_carterae.1
MENPAMKMCSRYFVRSCSVSHNDLLLWRVILGFTDVGVLQTTVVHDANKRLKFCSASGA